MKDKVALSLIILIITIIILFIVIISLTRIGTPYYKANKAIKEYEKSLPRDQYCIPIIKAIAVKKK